MNSLFKVNSDSERITISARQLHLQLDVGTKFKDWFPRMCDYGFEEKVDFNPLKIEQVRLEGNREVRRELQDYQITIEMAKEIAMLQRTEKGKEIRQKLIQLEKDWNSPQKVMARALVMANREIDTLKIENEAMKPKAIFADAVAVSHDAILIGQLAKLLNQNGIAMGQKRLFVWLRENGYLCKSGQDYNLPTQRSMELKLFKIKERTVNNPDGSVRLTRTTLVTGKGQQYFVNKFLN